MDGPFVCYSRLALVGVLLKGNPKCKAKSHEGILTILQKIVITLGNHDFDRYEEALFTMLEKANQMNLDINVIVSNLLPLPKSSKFHRFYEEKSSVKFLPHLIKAQPTRMDLNKKSFS